MKAKIVIIGTGVLGSALVVSGSILQSSVGFVGLFLALSAIIAAGCFPGPKRSKAEAQAAKAAVIASILGH